MVEAKKTVALKRKPKKVEKVEKKCVKLVKKLKETQIKVLKIQEQLQEHCTKLATVVPEKISKHMQILLK